MNLNTLKSLEFDRLLNIISGEAHSDLSKKAVVEIVPFSSKEEVLRRQRLVGEIMFLSESGRPLQFSEFSDITPLTARVRPEGAMLDANELGRFIPFLAIASSLAEQISKSEDITALREMTFELTGFPDLLKLLVRSVDTEGAVLDSASRLLSDLRERIRKLDEKIRRNLEELVRDDKVSVFLQDDFITKRSGRWVIPVRMDSKGQVAGVVHDVSNSGETAFMEPLSVISSTNELENLVAEQKAEEIRILKALSSRIRESAAYIEAEFRTVVHLDMLNCLAVFGERLDMGIPEINDSGVVKIISGRHPLLFLALKKSGREDDTVPLDISLGGDDTVMVITGSNAGGKTIAIKTVGLLMLMALSGMPVPADPASSFPLLKEALTDIGDDQSIEKSLSTFSAHISNISRVIKSADRNCLVLIDELGTGTDPAEGAALACAVLKELRSLGALVFATTHLADIKGYVHRTEGMLNASMEFDQKTFLPLYRLRPGQPGQSYAIETALRFGLPERIIDSAREMLGGARVEFDRLIADLNLKRQQYEEGLIDLERQKAGLDIISKRMEEQKKASELRYRETLAEAYKQASEVVRETKRQMHDLLEEMKKKEKEAGREALRKARESQAEIEKKVREFDTGGLEAVSLDEISEGDSVFVRSLGYDAVVTNINRAQNRLRVRSGGKDIELPASDISMMRGREIKGKGQKVEVPASDEMPVHRLNLIGLRVDEAISQLEPFLNHASLSGISEVTIIHGFGTGILARAVREHLKGHQLIESFRPGERTEGGGGVTVARLK